jgi:hypothetical protein
MIGIRAQRGLRQDRDLVAAHPRHVEVEQVDERFANVLVVVDDHQLAVHGGLLKRSR